MSILLCSYHGRFKSEKMAVIGLKAPSFTRVLAFPRYITANYPDIFSFPTASALSETNQDRQSNKAAASRQISLICPQMKCGTTSTAANQTHRSLSLRSLVDRMTLAQNRKPPFAAKSKQPRINWKVKLCYENGMLFTCVRSWFGEKS